jgi:hypothetical protein
MNRQEMISALKEDVCRVTFKKVNGDTRLMYCTLKSDFLPENDRMMNEAGFEPTKQVNEKVLAVWDIDVKGWRSFRVDSVTHFDSNPNAE